MVVLVVVFVLVSGLRMAELGHCGDRRTGAGPRRADAARPARRDPRAAPGTGPAPDHTGQGPGRQGVLLTGDPHPAAHARDRRGHPRTGRPTRQPHTPRAPRRMRLARWSAGSGMTATIPRVRIRVRVAREEYALSPRTLSGVVRGRPGPRRGTRISSSRSGSICPSWPCPGATITAVPQFSLSLIHISEP